MGARRIADSSAPANVGIGLSPSQIRPLPPVYFIGRATTFTISHHMPDNRQPQASSEYPQAGTFINRFGFSDIYLLPLLLFARPPLYSIPNDAFRIILLSLLTSQKIHITYPHYASSPSFNSEFCIPHSEHSPNSFSLLTSHYSLDIH